MNDACSFGPSTMLPDWVSWAVALCGILLFLWPCLFRRKPKPTSTLTFKHGAWGDTNSIILDSWEPKWPDGQ